MTVNRPGPAAADVAVYLDPPSHQQLGNRLLRPESSQFTGDNLLAPYAALGERLTKAGIVTQTADQLPERPDGRRHLVISFGTRDRMVRFSVSRYRALARRTDVVMSAFFAMECPIVEPTMYQWLPALSTIFRRTYSWTDAASLRPFTRKPVQNLQSFWWPQSFDAIHERLWSQRDRKFLVMMNANKLPRLYVDELYTSRLRAVAYFEQFGEIDLFGPGWGDAPMRVGKTWTPYAIRRFEPSLWRLKQKISPDPTYAAIARAARGRADSKSETIAGYRFALCFENSILKGWMTEKLFDCFFAGTIPVYWGAPDVLERVPADCFIDMRQFSGFEELRRFLHAVTPAQEQRYREAAREYLASDQFTPFRTRTFVETIAGVVCADTGLAV
jgi:alpha(1,3/1,4) fucosyltransferase